MEAVGAQSGEFSAPGLLVSAASIPIMYSLSRNKLRLANALGSRALRADAIESITCGWLAFVVVAALAAQLATGLWWIDPVASLGIVWFLVREGKEAWQGDRLRPRSLIRAGHRTGKARNSFSLICDAADRRVGSRTCGLPGYPNLPIFAAPRLSHAHCTPHSGASDRVVGSRVAGGRPRRHVR